MAKKKPSPEQFTPRVWKVLAGAIDRDGYEFGGGEARAVALLLEHELCKDASVGPHKRVVKATIEGEKLYADYLKAQGHEMPQPVPSSGK